MKELKIFNLLEGKILFFHLVWALSFVFPAILDSSIKKNKSEDKLFSVPILSRAYCCGIVTTLFVRLALLIITVQWCTKLLISHYKCDGTSHTPLMVRSNPDLSLMTPCAKLLNSSSQTCKEASCYSKFHFFIDSGHNPEPVKSQWIYPPFKSVPAYPICFALCELCSCGGMYGAKPERPHSGYVL